MVRLQISDPVFAARWIKMLYLLTFSSIILFLLVFISLWKCNFRGWYNWILIPFLIFNLGFSWYTLLELKGWPYHSYPINEYIFIHGFENESHVYLILQDLNEEPRLYAIPYTEENSKRLQKGLQLAKQGYRVMIRNQPENPTQLEFYEFSFQKKYPKD